MMKHKLTSHAQISKTCADGCNRNFLLFFLDGVQILKQKIPYDEDGSRGFDKTTRFHDIYLLGGNLYQTRETRQAKDWSKRKTRHVSYPVSKKKLKELGVDPNIKINLDK